MYKSVLNCTSSCEQKTFHRLARLAFFSSLRKNFNTEEEFRAFLGNAEARQSCLAEVGVRIGVRSGDETSCS